MIRLLKILVLATGGFALAVLLLSTLLLWLMGMLNRQGVNEALDFVEHNSPATIWETVMMDLGFYGDAVADPAFGRELVTGRGHAPWVLRGNLDGEPRVLEFALAPGHWAAYRTGSASLYQMWRGDILFEGSVYDYRHGPQPTATGEWYVRHAAPGEWALSVYGNTLAADVQYLGHRYQENRRQALFDFALRAAELQARVSERPELVEENGSLFLQRNFSVQSSDPGLRVVYRQEGQEPINLGVGETTVTTALQHTTPIAVPQEEDQEGGDDVSLGKKIVANSDCLGCHNETHQVVGPSFARIAQKFRGKVQQGPVEVLTSSIIDGSQGVWGKVPMPGHPGRPREDARAAVVYILSLSELDIEEDIPLDEHGNEYAFTRDYDVGERLTTLHPAFELDSVIPEGFEPKVGGMDFRSDGKLLVASWDRDGAVFLVDVQAGGAAKVRRIAEGLHEPLGLTVRDERVYVQQKQEVTELGDSNGDEIIDHYRTLSNAWPTSANFHSFAFGLVHKEGYLYGLLSVCILPGGATCPEQEAQQGKLFRVSLADGATDFPAAGFRTPNGIALGPNGELMVNDNQGDWLPSSKLLVVEPGKFYGFRGIADKQMRQLPETPPAVWLPQDEIGNSPSEPALLIEGPYAGQMIHGDVYHVGIKRVYLETVAGALQGAVFRFSGGFQGGVNRITRGPDQALYIGEIGNPPNWGEVGKAWHGLERLRYRGAPAYEILQVNATAGGFDLTLTEPLADGIVPEADDLSVLQWFYYPNEQYGGPKIDPTTLAVESLQLSADRRTLRARIPGLKAGYVVYLALERRLRAADGDELWTNEAWYTLNAIPHRG